MPSLTAAEVLSSGPLTTIQDLGRAGLAHLGVSRSGAADPRSLRLANQILGNPAGCACLETTLVGPRLRIRASCKLALTGAVVNAILDGEPVAMNSTIEAHPGMTLKVGTARSGLRTYIAFAGGIDCAPVLGSRSADLRSAIGPARLSVGDRLQLREPPCDSSLPQPMSVGNEAQLTAQPLPSEAVLRLILGPRDDWFTADALATLTSAAFVVSPQSDRVGVRLQGPALARRVTTELRSEGLVPGAIQVPPDGQPILMLADHPTTGGYPVAAVVHSDDLWLGGQLRPGQRLRFVSWR